MGKTVLIVDDSPIIRLALRELLEDKGYVIVGESEDGRTAVRQYEELRPDIVTMDITMPDLDGIDALQEILRMDKNAKVIMITAIDQREILMRAIQAGAVDYIVKPFEHDRVLTAFEQICGEKPC